MYCDEHKSASLTSWRSSLTEQCKHEDRSRLLERKVKEASIEVQMAVLKIGTFPIDEDMGCIRGALEDRDALLDFEVSIAAEWFAIAGKNIYDVAARKTESWALRPGPDCLWTSTGGAMTLERRRSWKKRLVGLQRQSEAADDAVTNRAAGRSLQEMERTERSKA